MIETKFKIENNRTGQYGLLPRELVVGGKPNQLAVRDGMNNRHTKPVKPLVITGKMISDFRRKFGLSQRMLAQAVQIEPSAIRGWEHGKAMSGPSHRLLQLYLTKPELVYEVLGIPVNSDHDLDYKNEVLTKWNSATYQSVTGDVNFDHVPHRVLNLWYGERGVAEASKYSISNMTYSKQQRYFKRIYDDFERNRWGAGSLNEKGQLRRF